MTAEASSPPSSVSVDPQDPLPESNWKWRRVWHFLGFLLVAFCLILALTMLGRIAAKAADSNSAIVIAVVKGLVNISIAMIIARALQEIFYLVAPSAEQLGKIFATLGALRSGISFKTSSTAEAPDGTKATTTSETKKDPATAGPPE